MIIETLVPIIGFFALMMSGGRILHSYPLAKLFFPLIIVAIALFARSAFITWCLIGVLCVVLRVAMTFFVSRSRENIDRNELLVLDRLILSMKAGHPLRFALKEIARELSPGLRIRLQEIVERLQWGGGDEGLPISSRRFYASLKKIDGASVKTMDRLESWRRTVRLREEFRRKSGQVSLQSRAQAAIAALLFIPAMFWNFHGVENGIPRAFLAATLFALGQFWIHIISRRFKWTV